MKWMLKYTVLAIIILSNPTNALDFDLCAEGESITHVPRADVTYQPETVIAAKAAIQGNKSEGDEMDSGLRRNDENVITIPITIDMAQRYNLSLPAGALLESNFGMMEIYKDGRIVYNGKEISGDIKDKCDHDSHSPKTNTDQSENQNGDYTDTGRELP